MNLKALQASFEGEVYFDGAWRHIYATDASAYREVPLAVAVPKTENDLKRLIAFADEHTTSLIPRSGGTSLAGQVVGGGIVVDISRHFTNIVEINPKEHWVKVQPGIVRDDLNKHLAPYNLFFAPETATANRATVGGMIGNNSCGSNSIVYGSTREHLLEATVLLSDGSSVIFSPQNEQMLSHKKKLNTLEGKIYNTVLDILNNNENKKEIEKEFPDPIIPRRNTGYAIDMLLRMKPFSPSENNFNLCSLLAGSEGTLAIVTEVKLNLMPIPSPHKALVCIHCKSIQESLRANLIALKYKPTASELIDNYILQCTKNNREHQHNRFFIQGDPEGLLVVEITQESMTETEKNCQALIQELQSLEIGHYYPILQGNDMVKVWNLRKAGLGLLGNIVGDTKPVCVIEDTAVNVQELPQYIQEFDQILLRYGLKSVYYAHAGTGELHLRPVLNLKTKEGQKMFRIIAQEIASLVKKYKGSLSGEHGDGRLRGEFIPLIIGKKNYSLLETIKDTFDPKNILNPGKIVRTPRMDTSLRYTPEQITKKIETLLDFESTLGIVRATEQCNGAGDCRKTHLSGGTMCPSYMATKNEKDTTRARANILREMLTHSHKQNPFDHKEIKEIMDLCLSCKGCKSECSSNVDIAKMKAEFLYQYQKENGISLRNRIFASFSTLYAFASYIPSIANLCIQNTITSNIIKKTIGIAPKRTLPLLSPITLREWFEKKFIPSQKEIKGTVVLFCDEFTNLNDAEIGIKTIQLLDALGYKIEMPKNVESGRSHLSKGMLNKAKKLAETNIHILSEKISETKPLIGIEPSCILSFRDEYIDITKGTLKEKAKKIAQHTFLLDEFFAREIEKNNIKSEQFSDEKKRIRIHGHCHQKALSSLTHTKKMLSLLKHSEILLIPSGCCGMAGSFGYEKEHYNISQQIGELVLFPTIRNEKTETIICASGTSCRHQIYDATNKKSLHPIEILWDALLSKNNPFPNDNIQHSKSKN